MIKTKKDLLDCLTYEKKIYLITSKHAMRLFLVNDQDYLLWQLIKNLRKLEFHRNNNHRFRALYYERKKNYFAHKCGVFLNPNTVGKGLKIWHYGDIIIHDHAVIGDNCQLHGMNCIGNKGVSGSGTPIIGNNANIGVGAKIIGDITLADNITIAANAVVTKSCDINGAVLAGIPAVVIGRVNNDVI